MIPQITKENLQTYRNRTFRLLPDFKLTNLEAALNFVNERGFVYLWPIKGITLPNLWSAVAGERPVANEHDDPGHITWGWKDDALGKRIWYYGKILRKKATMISLEVLPYFYALSENYGDPEDDVRIAYHEGRLTLEAKSIFEVLNENGPMDTIAIRRATRMTNKESNSRFDRALSVMQSDFKVLPVGISDAGAWRYAFIYDLTHRHYPNLIAESRAIKTSQARKMLIELYFQSVGVAQLGDLAKLFGWQTKNVKRTLGSLVADGILQENLKLENEDGIWYGLNEFLEGVK